MPGYRGHTVGGVLAALGLLWAGPHLFPGFILDAAYILIALVAAAIGARAPDIDVPSASRAFVTRFLIISVLIICAMGHWHAGALILMVTSGAYFMRHRGIFHSVLLWSIIILIGLYLITGLSPQAQRYGYAAVLFFGVGVGSHLLLDRMRI